MSKRTPVIELVIYVRVYYSFQTANATLSPSKLSSVPDGPSKEDVAEQQYVSRTKEVFERLFPSVASNVDYDIWLQNLCSQIEQLQQQNQQNCLKQKTNATNHQQQQNGGDDEDSAVEGAGVNGTHNNGQDNGSIKITPSTEELILQCAQLTSTVDSYKNIVADTVSNGYPVIPCGMIKN